VWQNSRKHTLISVRRVATEPKTALVGGIFEVFAGLKSSMASFNAEMAPSRPLGRWELTSMVEVVARRGCGVRAVRQARILLRNASCKRAHLVKAIEFVAEGMHVIDRSPRTFAYSASSRLSSKVS